MISLKRFSLFTFAILVSLLSAVLVPERVEVCLFSQTFDFQEILALCAFWEKKPQMISLSSPEMQVSD